MKEGPRRVGKMYFYKDIALMNIVTTRQGKPRTLSSIKQTPTYIPLVTISELSLARSILRLRLQRWEERFFLSLSHPFPPC